MKKSYKEIKNLIQQDILNGKLKPNERLPGGAELCKLHQVSHMTMDRALRELASDGLLVRDRQRGTVVTDRTENCCGRIALLVPSLASDSTIPEMVEGVESVIKSKKYNLLLANTECSIESAKSLVKQIVSEGIKGLIYVPIGHAKEFERNAEVLRYLKEQHIPFVVAGHCDLPDVGKISSVSSEHFKAAKDLTNHLISCGCERIVVVGGQPNQDHLAIIEGYRSALINQGIDVSDKWVRLSDSDEMIRSEVKHLMSSLNPPDAIFALGDKCAADIISSLKEININIPDDVAIVGFGDAPVCKYLPVPLTTAHVQHREEGKLLANMLIGILEGEINKATQITLPCPIIIRESCGVSLNRAIPA